MFRTARTTRLRGMLVLALAVGGDLSQAWEVRAAEPLPVRLNSVGYRPAARKHASVLSGAGQEFFVVDAASGQRVLSGKLAEGRRNQDTEETLTVADFSALDEPGGYRLEVPGIGSSPTFRVAEDIYTEPFRLAMRGMYLWRCGVAVSGEHAGDTFHHAACHLDDAYLDRVGGGHERRHAVGGWHDAGDHNKYVVNACVSVGCLLRAWEDFQPRIERAELGLPEAGGRLPEFLAEIKWELDWLLAMQADDGSVYHKVSTANYGGMVLPEQERDDRFLGAWGSSATASFTAALAQASRHYRPYDAAFADRCLAAARQSREFLVAHPEYHAAPQEGFATGGYESDDWDDRAWAEAELWEATGDAAILAAFEHRLRAVSTPAAFDIDWDWGNVKNLALHTYLASERDGRDPALVASLRASLLAAADTIVATAGAHGYSRPLGASYYWGCNGSVVRQSLVLDAAARIAGEEKYRAVQLDALNHVLGRNVYGRSFVTGLGYAPPTFPHDRRSAGDAVAAPWPGYLVGGAHPRAADWRDDQDDYRTNEIAINWNAALLCALAAQLPAEP
jgi:endoglucanase